MQIFKKGVIIVAGKVQGITVKIGGETVGLTKALKDVDKEIRSTQTQLKAVEKALKLDPKNTELLAEKQKLLTGSISDTEQKLVVMREAKVNADAAIASGADVSERQYRELQIEIVKAEKSLEGLQKEAKTTSSNMVKIGDEMQAAGKKMQDVGKKGLVVTGAVAGVGAAAIASFNAVDDGADIAIKKTGAVGDSAVELEGAYKNVAKEIPASFDEIGNAVGGVSVRLGLTGQDLEEASKQFLKFARVNDTDVATAVQDVTRYMGDAGIESSEYGDVLDELTAASKKSGIAVGDLSQNLTKYGAPMRALGFDTKESISMFALWEKTGVNTEIAFSGMKTAIGKWAKEGKNGKEEFSKTLAEIEKAPDISTATGLAIEAFGKKAGPDMADAIKGGKFNFQEYMSAIENSDGITTSVFDEVTDGSDDMQLAMQNGQIALADVGKTIMELLAPAFEAIIGAIQGFSEWFSGLSTPAKTAIVVIGAIAALLPPLLILLGAMAGGIGVVTGAIGSMNLAFLSSPITWIVIAIGLLVAGFVLLWNNCEDFRNFWIGLWDGICNAVKGFKDFIIGLATWVYQNVIVPIYNAFIAVATWFNDNVIIPLINFFTPIIEAVVGIFAKIIEIVFVLWGVVATWFNDSVIAPVVGFFRPIVETITGFFKTTWDNICNVFSAVGSFFSGAFEKGVTAIKNVFGGVVDFFKGIWDGIVKIFTNIGTSIGNAIGGAFKAVVNSIISFAENTINGFIRAINGAISMINNIPGVNISHLNLLNIPRMATGGVLSTGSAIVGEAGPELLSMINGKTVVRPLKNGEKAIPVSDTKSSVEYNQQVTINSPQPLSEAETTRLMRKQTIKLLKGVMV